MPPKIVGLLLALNNRAQLPTWRVTSTSRGRAYLVSMATNERGFEKVEDLYRWLDEGLLVIKGSLAS